MARMIPLLNDEQLKAFRSRAEAVSMKPVGSVAERDRCRSQRGLDLP
jgi:hypothetical protein